MQNPQRILFRLQKREMFCCFYPARWGEGRSDGYNAYCTMLYITITPMKDALYYICKSGAVRESQGLGRKEVLMTDERENKKDLWETYTHISKSQRTLSQPLGGSTTMYARTHALSNSFALKSSEYISWKLKTNDVKFRGTCTPLYPPCIGTQPDHPYTMSNEHDHIQI